MARFIKKKSFLKRINGLHLSIALFLGLLVLLMYGVSNLSGDTLDRKEEALKEALNRGIVSCYSIEGTYPPSLSYLTEHYGLTYDESAFFVDYQSIGANIFPDVTVIRRENN